MFVEDVDVEVEVVEVVEVYVVDVVEVVVVAVDVDVLRYKKGWISCFYFHVMFNSSCLSSI